MGKALIILAALTLAGCVSRSGGALPSNPRSIWCDHNSPRRDATSEIPRRVLDEINLHNALGEQWCGWTP